MLVLVYVAMAIGGCLLAIVFAAFAVGHGGGGPMHHGPDAGDDGGFSLLSPMTVAILVASIGAYGLIARYGLGAGDDASVLIAVGAGIATAYGVGRTLWRATQASRASTAIPAAHFAGATGDVITAIPAGGIGEVAVIVDGQRYTSSARTADGTALAQGTPVTVVRLAGTTLLVSAAGGGQAGEARKDG